MIGNLFSTLAMKVMGGLTLALAIILGIVMFRADQISDQRDAAYKALDVERQAHAITRDSVDLLHMKIDAQNAEIRAWEAKREESTRRAESALREAQRANARADEAIGRIKARVPVDCETGGEILDADL